MTSFLPFKVKYSPIEKLAIIPFEKNPDRVYTSFELQYINGFPYGKGYRIIAYRKDHLVDVYDDITLKFQENEKFNVAENGLNKHIQIKIEKADISQKNNKQLISFSFYDLEKRKVTFLIEEKTDRKTIPMNLLAPIGVGSKNPNYLPAFFMYNFDFIRKSKTKVNCKIENKDVLIDKFPLPINMQFRYYARYSNKCEFIEFINTGSTELLEVELDDKLRYRENEAEYFFEKKDCLKMIKIKNIQINFKPSINIRENIKGQFEIIPEKVMGSISGEYEVINRKNKTFIKLSPIKGWKSVPNSFITKMILNPNSVFCSWSKNYELLQEINFNENTIKAKWKNRNTQNSI